MTSHRITAQRAIASAYETAAEELKRTIARLEYEAEWTRIYADREEQRTIELPQAIEEAWSLIDDGYLPDQADAEAGARYSIPASIIAYHRKEQLKQCAGIRKWRRDREIVRLAWQGKTNREIGHRVSLHPNSVSRIVSAHLHERAKYRTRYEPQVINPADPDGLAYCEPED